MTCAAKSRFALVVQRLEASACLVEALSGGRLVFFRDGLQGFLQRRDATLSVTEKRDARGLERVEIVGRVEGRCPFSFDYLCFAELLFWVHILSVIHIC